MPVYKQPEFAQKCGISNAYLSVNKKRGKVIISKDEKGNEFVDDSIPENADFLQKCLDKAKKKLSEDSRINDEIDEEESTQDSINIPDASDKLRVSLLKPIKNDSNYSLDNQKKALDIQKITEEIEILKVKKDKLHGIVIPTDLVKGIIAQLSKSIIVEFKQASDNLLISISKKKGLNRNETAELKGELVQVINKAVDKAVTEAKKGIHSVVEQFSEKRTPGERA